MKKLNLSLLILFLLSACAPAATMTSTSAPILTATLAPTSTNTPSPTATFIPTATPLGGLSGKYLLELDKSAFQKYFPDLKGDVNFFTSNIDGTELVPVTEGLKGIYLVDGISPNKQKLLVTHLTSRDTSNGSFYIINLSSSNNNISEKLADGASALWIDNSHFVYTGNGKQGSGIYLYDIDGSNTQKIGVNKEKGTIIALDSTRVYLHGYVKKYFRDDTGFLYTYGDFDALWWANLNGTGEGELSSKGKQIIISDISGVRYAFSPDGKSIAWIPAEHEPGCNYFGFVSFWVPDGVYNTKDTTVDKAYVDNYIPRCFIMYVAQLSDMDHPKEYVLRPPNNFWNRLFTFGEDYGITWFPDGSKILLLDSGVWDKQYPQAPVIFYVSLDDTTKISLLYDRFSDDLAGAIRDTTFSPDGRRITMTIVLNQQRSEKLLDLQTLSLLDKAAFAYPFLYIQWLP